jgi:hypothetical protein
LQVSMTYRYQRDAENKSDEMPLFLQADSLKSSKARPAKIL